MLLYVLQQVMEVVPTANVVKVEKSNFCRGQNSADSFQQLFTWTRHKLQKTCGKIQQGILSQNWVITHYETYKSQDDYSTRILQSLRLNLIAKYSLISLDWAAPFMNPKLMGLGDIMSDAADEMDQSNVTIFSLISMVTRTLPDWSTSVSKVNKEPRLSAGRRVVFSTPSWKTAPERQMM